MLHLSSHQDCRMDTIGSAVDLLRLFGDSTRLRLVSLLEKNELTVAEITKITQLPQSRVSTHLGKLRDAGVLRDRREGALAYYATNDGSAPASVLKLWTLLGRSAPSASRSSARCWVASWTSHFCAVIRSAVRLCCGRGRVPPIGPKLWPVRWSGTTHQVGPGRLPRSA